MKKFALMIAVAMTLQGCATTAAAGLTPCEKALLAKMAAEKILGAVCPLAVSESEGVPENLLPDKGDN